MRQYTYSITFFQELENVIEMVNSEDIFMNAQSVLLQIYTSNSNLEFVEKIKFYLRDKFPTINIIGSTTCGEIFNGNLLSESTVLIFTVFTESKILVEEYSLDVFSEEQAGKQVFDVISNTNDIKGIQIFSTSSSRDLSKFINAFSPQYCQYPIFGAVAAVYGDFNENQTKVFGNKVYSKGIVVVIFTGKSLHIEIGFSLGWIPLGKEMIISETDGELCISKIDGVSAVTIYKKYLNVLPDRYFIENTCEFPLTIMRNGQLITRAPYKYDDDGKIYFTADVYKGEKIRLSYGNPKNILSLTEELSERIKEMGAQVLFLFACGNRLALLKEEAAKEINSYKTVADSINGFYAFTEIAKIGDKGGILNTAMVAVGMREGEWKDDIQINEYKDEYIVLNDSAIPFVERLLNFLEATTDELNQSNERLEKLSITDSLTGLINRRKIEEIIDYEIMKLNKTKLSVIMIDVDHFKKINDTYGHDIGDLVLKKVADILREALRQGDSVGRWGGEEFMMLLPDTNKNIAWEVAEKVRRTIETSVFDVVGSLSISLGVTSVEEREDRETIFKRVDNALYLAKKNGRNMTVIK